MTLKFAIVAADGATLQSLETMLRANARATLAGPPLLLSGDGMGTARAGRNGGPPGADAGSRPASLLQQLQSQAPEAVLVALAALRPGAAFPLLAGLRAALPLATLMAVGPMQPPELIVGAMRAGAAEYLEHPLRPGALAEALERCLLARTVEQRPARRGKLFAVLGARGGCGATTVAVNLALALHAQRRAADGGVVLLDAAPLGHAALHLDLKPQFTLSDLLRQAARLDAAMLASLMVRHPSGLELLAGPCEPLPVMAPAQHAAWLEVVLQSYPLVVADLSARLDGLTRTVIEQADRVLFVTQTDMVSLWSAAKVRQYLDATARVRFDLVLNRCSTNPEVDMAGLEALTRSALLWKLPNARALMVAAVERGRTPAARPDSELARSFFELAAHLLGLPATKPRKSWLPFLRVRAAAS